MIWLAIAAVTTVASGIVGFTLGQHDNQIAAAIKSASAAAGARPCAGSTVAPGTAGRLSEDLLPVPRDGSKIVKGEFRHQILSLNSYVKVLYSRDPAEKAELTARCFQLAAQRAWVNSSGQTIVVYLIEFGTAADARSYALATRSADMLDPANKIHSSVSGVPDGILIQKPSLDSFGNTLSRLIGDRGRIAVIIHLLVPAHLPQQSEAVALLRSQNSRL